MLFRRRTQLQFDSDDDSSPFPPLPTSPDSLLSETTAPYVRYSPAPSLDSDSESSSDSESTTSGSSPLSPDHDSVAQDPHDIQTPPCYLPPYRAVCNICTEDFQRYQVEQIEPLEPLRLLHNSHVFHAHCLADAIGQSMRQHSFECPTCRRPIDLQRNPNEGRNGLGHPSVHLFSGSSPRPLPRKPPTRRNRTRNVDRETSSEVPDVLSTVQVTSQKSPESNTQIPIIQETTVYSASKSVLSTEASSVFPPRPSAMVLSIPSAPIPDVPSSTSMGSIKTDEPHLCRLWNPSKPTASAPRRPCIPEAAAPHVQPDALDGIATSISPQMNASASTLDCRICNQPLVPAQPREGDATTNRSSETGISSLRKAPCGHIFHANCLDSLIPSCECQLLAGDIECPTCAGSIPLQTRNVDRVKEMMFSPAIPIMRAFGSMTHGRSSSSISFRGHFLHNQVPDPEVKTLPANAPSTWFRDLLLDYRLLAACRHEAYIKRLLRGVGRSQRFIFKLQSVFSDGPDFENILQAMQEKGFVTFKGETIRGPEDIWGHYILVSSVQDRALRKSVVGRAIWGVQRTPEEAKDAAALKVLHQLRGDDPVLN